MIALYGFIKDIRVKSAPISYEKPVTLEFKPYSKIRILEKERQRLKTVIKYFKDHIQVNKEREFAGLEKKWPLSESYMKRDIESLKKVEELLKKVKEEHNEGL